MSEIANKVVFFSVDLVALHFGFWILDFRFSILEIGNSKFEIGIGIGIWNLEFEIWNLCGCAVLFLGVVLRPGIQART